MRAKETKKSVSNRIKLTSSFTLNVFYLPKQKQTNRRSITPTPHFLFLLPPVLGVELVQLFVRGVFCFCSLYAIFHILWWLRAISLLFLTASWRRDSFHSASDSVPPFNLFFTFATWSGDLCKIVDVMLLWCFLGSWLVNGMVWHRMKVESSARKQECVGFGVSSTSVCGFFLLLFRIGRFESRCFLYGPLGLMVLACLRIGMAFIITSSWTWGICCFREAKHKFKLEWKLGQVDKFFHVQTGFSRRNIRNVFRYLNFLSNFRCVHTICWSAVTLMSCKFN